MPEFLSWIQYKHDLSFLNYSGYSCPVLSHWLKLPPTFEPPHDKTNKVSVRPAKTQISLVIRPV